MSRVSPLKIRVFQGCRLRFRYQYVEKDERTRPRLRPADTAGSLAHRVLCDFFTKVPENERDRERLLSMFEDGWRALSPGYHRIPGVEKYRASSLQQLNNFADVFGLDARPFMVEPYFQVEVEEGLTLFGRLDRLDEEPDGTLHIIDYKTGSQPGDIDPGQLVFYAILVEAKLGRTVSKASFWYLDDGSTWTMEFSDEDKRRAREQLMVTVQEMESVGEFPPTIGPHCPDCPFYKVCEFREQIDAERAREDW